MELSLLQHTSIALFLIFSIDSVLTFGFDGAEEEEKAASRYQMVFVVDRTNNFNYFYDNLDYAIGKFAEHMREDYKGTEVAIVSFGGDAPHQVPHQGHNQAAHAPATHPKKDSPGPEELTCTQYQPLTRVHTNPVYWTFVEPEEEEEEGQQVDLTIKPPPPASDTSKDRTKVPTTIKRDACYNIEQTFTANLENIAHAISRIPTSVHQNGTEAEEHALTALWIAIQDPRLGWSKTDKDEDGTEVQKLIILLTDNAPSWNKLTEVAEGGGMEKRRKRYILKDPDTGPDNCQYIPDATAKSLSEYLIENFFNVIVGLPRQPKWANNLLTIYAELFNSVGVPYDIVEFHAADQTDMTETIGGAIGRLQKQKPIYDITVDRNGQEHVPATMQLAFMLDRSSTFTIDFFLKFSESVRVLIEFLQLRFKSVEIAIVLFSDYTSNQWDHRIEGLFTQFNDSVSCYFVQTPFTSDPDEIVKSIQSIQLEENVGGDVPSDQLTALLLTITDSNIGWKSNDEEEEEGEEIAHHKIITFITDSDSHTVPELTINKTGGFIDWESRRPAAGDGTDTCENSFLPTLTQISEALDDAQVRIIGLLDSKIDPFILNEYTYYLNSFPVPYSLAEVNSGDVDGMMHTLIASLPYVLPVPVQGAEGGDEEMTEPEENADSTTEAGVEKEEAKPTEEPETEAPPVIETSTESPEEFEEILIKHYDWPTCDVSDPTCLDPNEDDEWDPPGYNTLGL